MEKELRHMSLLLNIKFSIIFLLVGTLILCAGVSAKEWYYAALGLILVVLGIGNVFYLLFKNPLRFFNKYIEANPNTRIDHIEQDFVNAQKYGKYVWAGKKWTIFLRYSGLHIIENEKIVWAYKYTFRSNMGRRCFINAYDTNKKQTGIPMKEKFIDSLLKYYYETYGVIVGYDEKYKNMVGLDFNKLLQLRYGTNNYGEI